MGREVHNDKKLTVVALLLLKVTKTNPRSLLCAC